MEQLPCCLWIAAISTECGAISGTAPDRTGARLRNWLYPFRRSKSHNFHKLLLRFRIAKQLHPRQGPDVDSYSIHNNYRIRTYFELSGRALSNGTAPAFHAFLSKPFCLGGARKKH
jgi:hypothetical protein